MGFPPMPRYVRNDPFGPASHNNLLQRQDWLYDFHGVEHDPSTGEHNTPLISRTLGHVSWNGAAYSLSGFNADASLASGHNPTPGTVIITLPAARYFAQRGVLEVQAADDSSSANAWFVSGKFIDDTHVAVYLKKDSGSQQQSLAATDGSFFIGIRSAALNPASSRPTGASRRSMGQGLRVDDWNTMIQQTGDNRARVLEGHTAAGLHDVREVSKAWGIVRWNADTGHYSIDRHQGLGAGVEQLSAGVVRVHLGGSQPAMVAPVQAFACALSEANGGQHGGIVVPMVPANLCGASSVDVYLWQSRVTINLVSVPATVRYGWGLLDASFSIRVHGA